MVIFKELFFFKCMYLGKLNFLFIFLIKFVLSFLENIEYGFCSLKSDRSFFLNIFVMIILKLFFNFGIVFVLDCNLWLIMLIILFERVMLIKFFMCGKIFL